MVVPSLGNQKVNVACTEPFPAVCEGHISFSPNGARILAALLVAHAKEAERRAKTPAQGYVGTNAIPDVTIEIEGPPAEPKMPMPEIECVECHKPLDALAAIPAIHSACLRKLREAQGATA